MSEKLEIVSSVVAIIAAFLWGVRSVVSMFRSAEGKRDEAPPRESKVKSRKVIIEAPEEPLRIKQGGTYAGFYAVPWMDLKGDARTLRHLRVQEESWIDYGEASSLIQMRVGPYDNKPELSRLFRMGLRELWKQFDFLDGIRRRDFYALVVVLAMHTGKITPRFVAHKDDKGVIRIWQRARELAQNAGLELLKGQPSREEKFEVVIKIDPREAVVFTQEREVPEPEMISLEEALAKCPEEIEEPIRRLWEIAGFEGEVSVERFLALPFLFGQSSVKFLSRISDGERRRNWNGILQEARLLSVGIPSLGYLSGWRQNVDCLPLLMVSTEDERFCWIEGALK